MDADASDDEVPSLVPPPSFATGDEEQVPDLVAGSDSATPSKVPITIVTGYLGAGKTTLLNYILTEQHGKKIAVILNEFGDCRRTPKSLTSPNLTSISNRHRETAHSIGYQQHRSKPCPLCSVSKRLHMLFRQGCRRGSHREPHGAARRAFRLHPA
jgi:hypothetical protein